MAKQMNLEIRKHASSAGVKLWQVAEELGITDFTLSRKLRHELPEDKKAEILAIIDRLAAEEGSR